MWSIIRGKPHFRIDISVRYVWILISPNITIGFRSPTGATSGAMRTACEQRKRDISKQFIVALKKYDTLF
jgi:hypothetical protein